MAMLHWDRGSTASALHFLAIALLLASSPAAAQSLPSLPDSATIRVWAPSLDVASQRATFVTWQSSSLRTVHADSRDTLDLAFPSITRLEVLQGKDYRRGVLAGAVIGGVVGGLIGYLVGNGAVSGCTEFLCELDAIGYVPVGFAIGALPGMAIGAAAAPDRWVRQSLPPEMGFPDAGPDRSGILYVSAAVLFTMLIVAGS